MSGAEDAPPVGSDNTGGFDFYVGSTNFPAPGDKYDGQGNSRSRGSKVASNFESSMSAEQISNHIVVVFSNRYVEACYNENLVSDFLSVRDLRLIVKNLHICETSDIFGHRKPALIRKLQEFMRSEDMLSKAGISGEEKEKIMSYKPEKKPEKASSRQPISTENQIVSNVDQSRNSEVELDATETESKSFNFSLINTTDAQKAYCMIQKFNQLIWDISSRITELERAASILMARLSELEKYYREQKQQ